MYCTYCGWPFIDEVTSNGEEIKPVALSTSSYIWLEASGSQLLENSAKLKFYRNLLEGFGVDLKTYFGLVMPNQYCQAVMKEK